MSSKLPRTHDLPHAEEGFDPARVEEAFATFAERVHELEAVAAELREELRSLRTGRVPAPAGTEVWPLEAGAAAASPEWIGAVPAPLHRSPAVPRLALEAAFLLLVALFAGLADLAAAWIVLVMAAAWALVALSEWAAAAKRARWRLEEIPPQLAEGAADSTGPWDMPVVEATAVDAGPDPESATVVAKLPETESPATDAEPAAEPEPRRRFALRLPWRKRAETPAGDPWESTL